jgi:Fe-S cluster assembly iron-binding protein IscA
MFIRCPFCHKRVLKWWYAAHERKHTERLPDGQMRDHITKPVEERYTGSLDGIPQTYRHPVCGVATGMPEEIIRSYLVNPLLYSDGTFCCGCGTYVGMHEVRWVETGEVVLSYMARLRLEHLRTVRGITVNDPANDIVITPEAAEAIRASVPDAPASTPLYLRLELGDGERPDYHMDATTGADPATETIIECDRMSVVVPRSQADRIRGIVVDFKRIGTHQGLSVSRLSLPRG